MTKERLYLYDTTLRDGQQTQGVQFSTSEKKQIAQALDTLGVDYIEGGWPGANPTDSEFFEAKPKMAATFTAFGMTKRAGMSAENDDVLAAVLNAGTPAVCLVGKSHDFHVDKALGITLAENTENIAKSIAHIKAQGREALFDAEHFFEQFAVRFWRQLMVERVGDNAIHAVVRFTRLRGVLMLEVHCKVLLVGQHIAVLQ